MDSIFKQMGSVIKTYVDTKLSYDLATYVVDKPTANEVILRFRAARAFTIAADQTNAQFKAATAATASATFNIAKNGTSIGTAVFAAGSTVATINFAAAVSFAIGDVLSITAPATADATLANIDVTLLAFSS